MCNLSIVTMFFILPAKRNKTDYIPWIQNFFSLHTNVPIYLFTDNESYRFISKFVSNAIIIFFSERDSPWYTLQWDKNFNYNYDIKNYPSPKVSHYYNLKLYFMYYIMSKKKEKNNLLWVDIGIFRNIELFKDYQNSFPRIITENTSIFHIMDHFQTEELINIDVINTRFNIKYQTRINTGVFFIPNALIAYYYGLYRTILNDFFQKNIFAGNEQILFNFMVLQSKVSQNIIRFPCSFYPHDPWFFMLEYFGLNRYAPHIIYPLSEQIIDSSKTPLLHFPKKFTHIPIQIKLPNTIAFGVILHTSSDEIEWCPVSFTLLKRIYALRTFDEFTIIFFNVNAYSFMLKTFSICQLLRQYIGVLLSYPKDALFKTCPINHYSEQKIHMGEFDKNLIVLHS